MVLALMGMVRTSQKPSVREVQSGKYPVTIISVGFMLALVRVAKDSVQQERRVMIQYPEV